MEQGLAKAYLKGLRIAPRKVRLLVDLIRGMRVEEAKHQLMFSKKNAARPLMKLLDSAVANAVHNHKMIKETLVIESAFVNEGPTLKRWMPRAFGRATPIRKRSSHITIVLSGAVEEPKKKKKAISRVSNKQSKQSTEEKKPTTKKEKGKKSPKSEVRSPKTGAKKEN